MHPSVRDELKARAAGLGIPWPALVRSVLDRWLEGPSKHVVKAKGDEFTCTACGVCGSKDLLRVVPCGGAS